MGKKTIAKVKTDWGDFDVKEGDVVVFFKDGNSPEIDADPVARQRQAVSSTITKVMVDGDPNKVEIRTRAGDVHVATFAPPGKPRPPMSWDFIY